jgi:multidrug efflux pump subunit AcrA (membrane-fusion protein)
MLAGVLALTSVGGFAAYQRLAPAPVVAARITTADVARGSIAATVSATGSVAAPAQSKLSFKSGGRLAELLASVGDQVAEGQPLARIDTSDLEVALVQARAGYSSAVAKLEQTKAGSRPEDIRATQSQVDAARIKLEQTRGVTQGPDVAAAQSQLQSARLKLEQLLNPRPEDVTAAQAQLDSATAKLQALTNPRPEDVAAAQSQLQSARLKLEQLQNPRAEDIRNAEGNLASARTKLQALTSPRPEDLAAAQSALDQQETKLAQLMDMPRTAKPEDIANAQLAVQNAQVAVDKARADATNAGKAGSSLSQAAADAAIAQAMINLQTQQNNLSKLESQGPSEWDIRVQQIAVEQAKASLDKLRNPSSSDVQTAQIAVEQAQAALDKLRTPSAYDLQVQEEAVKQAQLALDKLANPTAADLEVAQQAVVTAQSSLAKLQTPSPFDIQIQQESIRQAQASLDKLVSNNAYDVQTSQASYQQALASLDLKRAGPTEQDLLVAMASVDQAAAQLKQAEANLAAATLHAPYPGVVAATAGNVGEQVGAGTAVVTLVDTRQVRVDVVVDETDVAKIQVNQPATLTFEALTGQRLNGRVAVIAPTGTVQQGVVNYQVQIQVDPAQARAIRPGMTSTASIVVASREDVVVVPNRAIRTQGRNRTVEVLDAEGKTSTRPVQVGMAGEQITEILEGLQPGDKVVIPTTTTAAPRVGGLGGPVGGPGPGGGVVIRQGG